MSMAVDVVIPAGVAQPMVADISQADELLFLCANLGMQCPLHTLLFFFKNGGRKKTTCLIRWYNKDTHIAFSTSSHRTNLYLDSTQEFIPGYVHTVYCSGRIATGSV